MPHENILNDDRRIRAIATSEGNCFWEVGHNDVNAIRLESVPGDGAFVPWFQVWRNGELWQRVNGKYVESITYVSQPIRGGAVNYTGEHDGER